MQKSSKNYAQNAVSSNSAGAPSLTTCAPLARAAVSSGPKQSLSALSKQAIPLGVPKHGDDFISPPPGRIKANWKQQIAAPMPAEQRYSDALEREHTVVMVNDGELQLARKFLEKFFREARILEVR